MQVAPREIHDTVAEACQVSGIDASSSAAIAAAARFGEIHGGGALVIVARCLAVPAGAREQLLAPQLSCLDAELTPGPPVRCEVAGAVEMSRRAIDDAARRGVRIEHSDGAFVVVDRPVDLAALAVVDRRSQVAHAGGVEVDDRQWECLYALAATFRVSEATLDAASG